MSNILGILLSDDKNKFTSLPLLGMPTNEYVKYAMITAGADEAAFEQEELSVSDFDTVLFAAGHTPCISSLTTLVQKAANTPCALVTAHGASLAVALPAKQLGAFDEDITLALLMEAYADTMQTVHTDCETDGIAVTDAQSYAEAYRFLRGHIITQHMQNGVIVLEPERTVIEAGVTIGSGTIIYPNNTLQGNTTIGTGCTLYPGSRMENAVIGNETTVENSVLLHCSVGSHTTVGPFAYLRPKANIGDHCRIGDFVEIKNSNVGNGTKISHLTYVGDGDLGQRINLGCGVVFSNYDGKVKHRTVVGDDAFIGCNVNLVPPVRVGKEAYVAAGSTVTEDVPDDSLYIARVKGTVKEGWVTRRKEKGKL